MTLPAPAATKYSVGFGQLEDEVVVVVVDELEVVDVAVLVVDKDDELEEVDVAVLVVDVDDELEEVVVVGWQSLPTPSPSVSGPHPPHVALTRKLFHLRLLSI